MSRQTFEKYGQLAESNLPHTVVSGRYGVQKPGEAKVLQDLNYKLDLKPTDDLLEVGCGPGNMLIPLSFIVQSATGIDHPKTIERFRDRFKDERVTLHGVNFLDFSNPEKKLFDKILIYSVIVALSNKEEVFQFIDKACSLLKPKGRLLVGDIANIDKKKRFLETEAGKKMDQDWKERVNNGADTPETKATNILFGDKEMFTPTDAFMVEALKRYREKGFDAYCLPQPAELPFGMTREDILICRP